ncbi:RICIN domain-containing protein [Neiella sp. HB171785]|uniref:RICIN domain-containing protein n=1 Tax=Neiella litorisoli TaxID=2771431 RepID=A0A8J6QI50_9GAMM|nr:family 43 glycosylhydrolase [Neiella litorisoli]MBD1389003.1 RICIN domain-containing protein [Neiella litorisoli]
MNYKISGLALAATLVSSAACYADVANGVYTITSKYSGKLAEVGAAALNDGANINQWPANGHDTQKWMITQHDSGYYSIVNLNSAKAMEVYDWSTDDGANVAQWGYWGGDSQLWDISQQSDGSYAIINKNSGKALDLLSWDTADGANLGQWSYWGGDAQLWQLNLIQQAGNKPVDTSTTNGATNHWPITGNLVTHDPTIAYEDGMWWEFQTGDGIYGKYSHDGINWEGAAAIFPNGLSWWDAYVPGQNGIDVWAPDVKYYNGRTWLYYSISTFGSRTSAIGLASASKISAGDWQDHGLVINTTDSDNYNAIDPDLVIDEDGNPWLTFGSWNSGIKLMRLNPITMKPIGEMYSLASRSGGIEAPTIIYRQGYYYLFVSIGKCCAGVDSTYQIAYGRATSVTGPYLDKNGVDMMNSGGSILDAGSDVWVGPGGQDIANTDVIARHAYDATDNGTPKLLISILNWDSSGWPRY